MVRVKNNPRRKGLSTSWVALARGFATILFVLVCFSFEDHNIVANDSENSAQLSRGLHEDARTGEASDQSSTVSILVSQAGHTNSNTTTRSSLNPDLFDQNLGVGRVWSALLYEASQRIKRNKNPGIAMEVGMFSAKQCLEAAGMGLQSHCVEPSPLNMKRVRKEVQEVSQEVQDRVHLHQVAAAGESGGTLPFTSNGGTGDHIGTTNMWTMEEDSHSNNENADTKEQGPKDVVNVPLQKIDDIISLSPTGTAWALKIDTQGYEPVVFSGMQETLRQHKVKFILMEYWPKGMDIMTTKVGNCTAVSLLEQLLQAGYRLYAFGVEAHPKAPKGWRELVPERPLDDLERNCQWYYDIETKFPSEDYKMGYWSDILAVAPNETLSYARSRVGTILKRSLAAMMAS